jgi:hypothetical protein
MFDSASVLISVAIRSLFFGHSLSGIYLMYVHNLTI